LIIDSYRARIEYFCVYTLYRPNEPISNLSLPDNSEDESDAENDSSDEAKVLGKYLPIF